jgi:5'-nucleotidase (lipoprotein e(P4) family)
MYRILLPLLFFIAGCATSTPPVSTTPATVSIVADSIPLHGATHWVRSSAEHRAVFLQTFRLAERQLEAQAAGLSRGGWAVIMDADETAIDNSEYQKRRNLLGLPFTIESWNEWVRESAATALAGAPAFSARVRELGGRLVIVTNRDEEVCSETRSNLAAVGIVHDLVLCMQPGISDKNPRFESVERGTASPTLPALRVVMFVGDNIRDFPLVSQDLRDAPEEALSRFGVSWIMLPNPMYGSWERNPVR